MGEHLVGPKLRKIICVANPCLVSFAQFQDSSCTLYHQQKNDAAYDQVRKGRPGPEYQEGSGNHAQVDDNIVGGEDKAGLHMCFILVFRFLQEVKAIAVGQKSQDRDYNHGVEIRQFLRPQKAAKDFQKTQGGEQQLEVAGQPGYFFLPQERAANGINADPIHKGIGQHIQTVGYQAHRPGKQAGAYFDYKKAEIDEQYGPQQSFLVAVL